MFGITKVGNNVNSKSIREFVVDSSADIANLPHINTRGTQGTTANDPVDDCVMAGSSAICLEDGSIWILSNADVWTEV